MSMGTLEKDFSTNIPLELDITSECFDPVKALASSHLHLQFPRAKTYNNLAEYYSRHFLKKDLFEKNHPKEVWRERNYAWYYATLGHDSSLGNEYYDELNKRENKKRRRKGKKPASTSTIPCEPMRSQKVVALKSDYKLYCRRKFRNGTAKALNPNAIVPNGKNMFVDETQTCSEALPLPNEIQQMFATYPNEVVDEKHGGKIRSFPHERGVWATYVYIEYNAGPDFFQMIDKCREVTLGQGLSLDVPLDFHVSLSRTLKLRHHWIAPFVDALKAQLSCFYRFKLIFQSLEAYENEEKTRTFLGLKVHIGYEHLLRIVKEVDMCLAEFKLPCFYKNPSFHLSFASCVGSQSKKMESFLADLNVIFQSFIDSHTDCRTLWVSKVNCKSGNKLFTVNLKS